MHVPRVRLRHENDVPGSHIIKVHNLSALGRGKSVGEVGAGNETYWLSVCAVVIFQVCSWHRAHDDIGDRFIILRA